MNETVITYLVNLGFVSLYLKMSHQPDGVSGIFEALSGKLGVVMLILGGMHFFNIWLFARMGKETPPVIPVKPPAYAGWNQTDQEAR